MINAKTNGNPHHEPGPPFAVVSDAQFVIMPQSAVIESMEMNAAQQTKINLKLGPLFRKVADDFREYAKLAEPGFLFQAPEINLRIIRLARMAPVATSLSDEARKAAKPDTPRIVAE
jgi:hypothetical protein